MRRIFFGLFGAGGHGREVMPFVKESASIALSVPEDYITALFVETWQPKMKRVNSYPVISSDEFRKLNGEKYFNVAVGNGQDRKDIASLASKCASPLSLFSSQTTILHSNRIGGGALFSPNTLVTSNVTIGNFFQCNIFASVSHDCVIGDFVTFAPGVRCNGRVVIDDFAFIGANAVIREGTIDKPLRIGKGAVVGMGSVVTKDVPSFVTVVGNPARNIQKETKTPDSSTN
jgi:sugar O-acyltransferase (sialic acid O-acetyltransferase NeuD family)